MSNRVVFRPHVVRPKHNHHRFECAVCHGPDVYVGTADGQILGYRIQSAAAGEFDSKSILVVPPIHHRSPVKQLALLPELEIVLVLTDGTIYMLPFQPNQADQAIVRETLGTVQQVKNCTGFAVKKHRGEYTIAAAAKRDGKTVCVVSMWRHHDQAFGFVKDFNLPAVPKTIQWTEKTVLLGFSKEYVTLDITNGSINALQPVGKSGVPITCPLEGMRELMMLLDDSIGVRITLAGSPASRMGLQFPATPQCLRYVHPYVLAVVDQAVDVHYPFALAQPGGQRPRTLAQSISLRKADKLSVPSFVDFDLTRPTDPDINFRESYRRDAIVLLTEDAAVHLLEMVPTAEQVTHLFLRNHFDDAAELCRLCVNEVTRQLNSELLLQHGNHLFSQHKYMEGVAKFKSANTDPRVVLSFYTGFLTNEVKRRWRPPLQIQKQVLLAPPPATASLEEQGQWQEALLALVGYINPSRRPPEPGVIFPVQASTLGQFTEDETLLQIAVFTGLVHALTAQEDHGALADLLAKPNFCLYEDVKACLLQNGDYPSVGVLLSTTNEQQEALSLMRKVAEYGQHDAELPTRTSLSGTPVYAFMRSLLQSGADAPIGLQTKSQCHALVKRHFKGLPEDAEKAAHQLVGVTTAMHLLKTLTTDNQEKLTFQHVEWLLVNFPAEYTVRVFTDAKRPLPPLTVAKYLLKMPSVCAAYLTLILGQTHNALPDPDLHNWRVEVLIDIINNPETPSEQKRLNKLNLRTVLTQSEHYNEKAAIALLNASPEAKGLLSERAVVYRRLGMHQQAIRMFLDANCSEVAEEYARTVAAAADGTTGGGDAFRCLLRAHLTPTDPDEPPHVQEALLLIKKNASMDATAVLEELPEDVPLCDLKGFLVSALRAKTAASQRAAVEANLWQAAFRKADLRLAQEKSKATRVDRNTQCAACAKKINRTVFSRYPNGVVVHQACQTPHCPVSHKDFSKSLDAL